MPLHNLINILQYFWTSDNANFILDLLIYSKILNDFLMNMFLISELKLILIFFGGSKSKWYSCPHIKMKFWKETLIQLVIIFNIFVKKQTRQIVSGVILLKYYRFVKNPCCQIKVNMPSGATNKVMQCNQCAETCRKENMKKEIVIMNTFLATPKKKQNIFISE